MFRNQLNENFRAQLKWYIIHVRIVTAWIHWHVRLLFTVIKYSRINWVDFSKHSIVLSEFYAGDKLWWIENEFKSEMQVGLLKSRFKLHTPVETKLVCTHHVVLLVSEIYPQRFKTSDFLWFRFICVFAINHRVQPNVMRAKERHFSLMQPWLW